MMKPPMFRRHAFGVTIVLALLMSFVSVAVLPGGAYAQTVRAGATHKLSMYNVLPIKPLLQYARKLNAQTMAAALSGSIPPCLTSTVPPRCYNPQQIRNAYSIQSLLSAGITGKGHTIVLIDFATSPSLQSDVHLYDQLYGLKDPKINVYSPFSTASVDPNYYFETALDIEEAHSLAPDATIDLVLANVDNQTDFRQFLPTALQATQYAVQNNLGDVISQSFGVGESCAPAGYVAQEEQVFSAAAAKGITVLASSGDYGAAVITCSGTNVSLQLGVSLPASDPYATAVGGTTLNATQKTGAYAGETTWNDNSVEYGIAEATGGGLSTLFAVPSYQKNIAGLPMRGVPDVAFDADPNTGVPVVFSEGGATLIVPVGGTSVGSPAWAGVVVLLNQKAGHRLGFLNPAVYGVSTGSSYAQSFHDILYGDNSVVGFDTNGNSVTIYGYGAFPGWDPVTGVGSPIVKGLATSVA